MDKKFIDRINSLEVGETLDVKIKCVEDKDTGCEGCVLGEWCMRIVCQKNGIDTRYIIEL